MHLPHSPSSAGREELVSRWLAGMGTVWTVRYGQRTYQSEELIRCGIFWSLSPLVPSKRENRAIYVLFFKSKHKWLCAQKICKLTQTYLSLVLREQEETKRHILLPTEIRCSLLVNAIHILQCRLSFYEWFYVLSLTGFLVQSLAENGWMSVCPDKSCVQLIFIGYR